MLHSSQGPWEVRLFCVSVQKLCNGSSQVPPKSGLHICACPVAQSKGTVWVFELPNDLPAISTHTPSKQTAVVIMQDQGTCFFHFSNVELKSHCHSDSKPVSHWPPLKYYKGLISSLFPSTSSLWDFWVCGYPVISLCVCVSWEKCISKGITVYNVQEVGCCQWQCATSRLLYQFS